jgi:hypothetical protein
MESVMGRTISTNSGSILLSSAHPNDNPLTILTGITVSGPAYGVEGDNSQAWALTNQGFISGTSLAGVYLAAGGTVTNTGTTASIFGGKYGVLAKISVATVTNQGTIFGAVFDGLDLGAGGTVMNSGTAARISGGQNGVYVKGNEATVTNQGTISGVVFLGVYLGAGGIVTNSGTAASITGEVYGVLANGGATTVTNEGAISGTAIGGVYLAAGTVTNSSTTADIFGQFYGVLARQNAVTVTNQGTISSTSGYGVFLGAGGKVTNSGSIAGGKDAVLFAAGHTSRLVIDPGAVFSGTVDGGNTIGAAYVSTLELASAASAGSVTGLGTAFTNFGSIVFDTGVDWLVQGDIAGLAAGQMIGGFTLGDTIELTGFAATSDTFTASGLVLTGTGGSEIIGIQGGFSTGDFVVTNDGTNSMVELACFAVGTRILTARGSVAVESLQLGNMVMTDARAGWTRPQAVVWIGHRTIDCRRHPRPRSVWPVRVSAHAFGQGMPARDLRLSPDHAVFVAEVLIPVKHLINGKTIVQIPVDTVSYCHISLPAHDVLLAEGLAAESYLDTGDRSKFLNGGGPIALHPDFSARTWEAMGCAPLIVTGPVLASVHARLMQRATMFAVEADRQRSSVKTPRTA